MGGEGGEGIQRERRWGYSLAIRATPSARRERSNEGAGRWGEQVLATGGGWCTQTERLGVGTRRRRPTAPAPPPTPSPIPRGAPLLSIAHPTWGAPPERQRAHGVRAAAALRQPRRRAAAADVLWQLSRTAAAASALVHTHAHFAPASKPTSAAHPA